MKPRAMTRSLTTALLLISGSLASILPACSSSTPGRGGVGNGNAYCSSFEATQCSCSTSQQVTGVATGGACPGTTVQNAVCCGDIQWPGSGLACSCESYQCKLTGTDGSCMCGHGTTGPMSSCAPAVGSTCCQHAHEYCECGPSVSCETSLGDVAVTTCSKETAQCLSSTEKVFASCQ
jgi:hypothetical protein